MVHTYNLTNTLKENPKRNPRISQGLCTWVTYCPNHILFRLHDYFLSAPPSPGPILPLTSYCGSACAPLIKLELDKPDNSRLTSEDRGKCAGKIMMRERERSRGQSTQKWEPSIFNAHFLNMNPRQRGASSSVTPDLPDSNPYKQT